MIKGHFSCFQSKGLFMDVSEGEHWLITAARTIQPDISLPSSFVLSEKPMEAWEQVEGVFKINGRQLAKAVADMCGLKAANPSLSDMPPVGLLPESTCRELNVLPLYESDNKVVFGTCEPDKTSALESQIKFSTGHQVEFEILSPELIDAFLTGIFAKANEQQDAQGTINLDIAQHTHVDDVGEQTVRLAKAILRTAIERRASDIHMQPFVGGGAIRFRIDGVLHRIATMPLSTLENLSRYLKVHGYMDPTKTMIAQDGRIRLIHGHKEYDVRMSVLPSFGGERIVARLLDQNQIFSVKDSGFSLADQQVLKRMSSYSAGIILLTGPTGSGKTSTLYSLLSDLNRVDVNIITIEEPVEYVLPGLSQVDVNNEQGLTFASSLRSTLRQDPDVVLVGEIRDSETAEIAAQAALTGHLVFSTLHTNDALTTIPRLLNLGLDPSILADVLVGVVSQRLVRKLCDSCSEPVNEATEAAEKEFYRVTGELPGRKPVGCDKCHFTGYIGRIPVVENVEITGEMRELMLAGEHDLKTLRSALGDSYRPMAANTAEWIVSGKTTANEAYRVMGMRFWNELAQLHGQPIGSIQISSLHDSEQGMCPQILFLTSDNQMVNELDGSMSQDLVQIEKEADLEARLNESQQVIAIIVDSRCFQQEPAVWLKQLRESLAWAGIPVIFLIEGDDSELESILSEHNAPVVKGFPVDKTECIAKIQKSLGV
mgnify:CR=1 FL=1